MHPGDLRAALASATVKRQGGAAHAVQGIRVSRHPRRKASESQGIRATETLPLLRRIGRGAAPTALDIRAGCVVKRGYRLSIVMRTATVS